MPDHSPESALIFRKRLLPYSETFVANQGYALRAFRPRFIGLKRAGGGVHHLRDGDYDLMAHHVRWLEAARLPMRLGGPPPTVWTQRLAAHKPAVLHSHFASGTAMAAPMARALGVPLVVTVHGHDISRPLTPLFRGALGKVFDQADVCIAVSRFIAERLREAGCPDARIVQHYIGVNLDGIEPSPVPSAPEVLFVGRLVEKKGVAYLIDAMAEVRRAVPEARLRIIGSGELEPSLRAQATSAGVPVQFDGACPPSEVFDAMRAARVIAAPSVRTQGDFEGLGMVFVEAQALGRPVVGFASGGVSEAVAHGETGLLAAERDVSELAEHLIRVLRDDAYAAQLGAAARARVERQFDLARQTRELEGIYRRVIDARR